MKQRTKQEELFKPDREAAILLDPGTTLAEKRAATEAAKRRERADEQRVIDRGRGTAHPERHPSNAHLRETSHVLGVPIKTPKAKPGETSRGVIFTVGYGPGKPAKKLPGFTREDVAAIVLALGAVLVDCRGRNTGGRIRKGFQRAELELSHQYIGDKGHELAGPNHGGTTAAGIAWIAEQAAKNRKLVLMCAEEAPGACHRHFEISLRLLEKGIDPLHIFRDRVVLASELDRHLDGSAYVSAPLSRYTGGE